MSRGGVPFLFTYGLTQICTSPQDVPFLWGPVRAPTIVNQPPYMFYLLPTSLADILLHANAGSSAHSPDFDHPPY